MRILLFTFVIFGFCSCSGISKKDLPNLEGEWIYTRETARHSRQDVGLKFDNDTLSIITNSGFWQEGKYELNQDTVNVEGFGGAITRYLILDYHQDTLTLTRGSYAEKLYNRRLEYSPNLKFYKIKFKTDRCYGYCPEFMMTLDRNGDVNFEGIRNTKHVGDTKFTIDTHALQTIDSLFKWSYIDGLDTTELYAAVDDWAMSITFYYNKDRVVTVSGTSTQMPYRLKRIIWRLTDEVRKKGLI